MTVPPDLVARIQSAAGRHGTFHLPDGQVIGEFFDQYLLAADPALLREVAAEMNRLVLPGTDVLVGIELGGIPLTIALSAASGLPAAFLRHEAKTYGTFRQLEGHPVTGRRVALVDDVVRSGTQALRAAAVLRKADADVTTMLCVLDRGLDGAVRLADEQISLQSVLAAAALHADAPARPGPALHRSTRGRWPRPSG